MSFIFSYWLSCMIGYLATGIFQTLLLIAFGLRGKKGLSREGLWLASLHYIFIPGWNAIAHKISHEYDQEIVPHWTGGQQGGMLERKNQQSFTKVLNGDQKAWASRDEQHERDKWGKAQDPIQMICKLRVWELEERSVCKGWHTREGK